MTTDIIDPHAMSVQFHSIANNGKGDGRTFWLTVNGEVFGLHEDTGNILDCDGCPLSVNADHISAIDERALRAEAELHGAKVAS